MPQFLLHKAKQLRIKHYNERILKFSSVFISVYTLELHRFVRQKLRLWHLVRNSYKTDHSSDRVDRRQFLKLLGRFYLQRKCTRISMILTTGRNDSSAMHAKAVSQSGIRRGPMTQLIIDVTAKFANLRLLNHSQQSQKLQK